jgi:hypothetical protein
VSECDRIVAWHFDGHKVKNRSARKSVLLKQNKQNCNKMVTKRGIQHNRILQFEGPDVTRIICSLIQPALKQQWFDMK